jgi:hypothetical protein
MILFAFYARTVVPAKMKRNLENQHHTELVGKDVAVCAVKLDTLKNVKIHAVTSCIEL